MASDASVSPILVEKRCGSVKKRNSQVTYYSVSHSQQVLLAIEPYPGPGAKCKVSTSGGQEPQWSRDGTELFYRQGRTVKAADVQGRDFCNAEPLALFEGIEAFAWTVSPSGDFFVTLEPRKSPRLHVVLNWSQELKARVPVP